MKRNKASVVLAVFAVMLWAGFGVLHALGLRSSVSVLSLTFPAHESFERAAFEMGVYVLAYFGAILVAPVLALAAATRALWERLVPRPAA